jgi:hypothetical protein
VSCATTASCPASSPKTRGVVLIGYLQRAVGAIDTP